jgi:uncharacterized protein involved in exopolysaccharide biosynthesis
VIARWRTVAVVILLAVIGAVLALVLVPPVYRARASFVTNSSTASVRLPQGTSGMRGMRGLGSLASQFGLGAPSDPSQSPQFYQKLIWSRELQTRLLESRFPDPRTTAPRDSVRLLDLLRIKEKNPGRKLELGVKKLAKQMGSYYDENTNFVDVSVASEWGPLSAAVTNRILELVSTFNREQRTSRARSTRVFLESRVAQVHSDLRATEARVRDFHEQNRSWRASPALTLQEQQIQREVEWTTDLYLSLQQQLENARLEEINDAALITVVDSAIPPRKADWPRYGVLIMSTLSLGLIVGLMFAGSAVVLADWRARNPSSASQLGGAVRSVRHEIGNAFRRAPNGLRSGQQRRAG